MIRHRFPLDSSSCEFNVTRAIVYSPSPFVNAAAEAAFVDELNARTLAGMAELNAALQHNLRFNRMPNLLQYNSTHGFVFWKSPWRAKACGEEFSYDNYVGCQYKTTTGLRCQTWEEVIPHLHPFSYREETYKATEPIKDTRGYNELSPYVQAELAKRQAELDASTTEAPEVFGVTTRSPNAPSEFGVTNFDPDLQFAGQLLLDLPIEGNFCRNPDGRNQGQAEKGGSNVIWCYTSDPLLRFDYCAPMAVLPVPDLCLTQVRGTQMTAPQSAVINLDGNPIFRNATTELPFLVPYEELVDEGMSCQDVHPDFNGEIGMYCNAEELTITFNTHCNMTSFATYLIPQNLKKSAKLKKKKNK
eukprot:g15364.t1